MEKENTFVRGQPEPFSRHQHVVEIYLFFHQTANIGSQEILVVDDIIAEDATFVVEGQKRGTLGRLDALVVMVVYLDEFS